MTVMPTTHDRMFSVREAAEVLGVSMPRVHQFIGEGRLKAERVGPVRAIPESELRAFQAKPRITGRPKS